MVKSRERSLVEGSTSPGAGPEKMYFSSLSSSFLFIGCRQAAFEDKHLNKTKPEDSSDIPLPNGYAFLQSPWCQPRQFGSFSSVSRVGGK